MKDLTILGKQLLEIAEVWRGSGHAVDVCGDVLVQVGPDLLQECFINPKWSRLRPTHRICQLYFEESIVPRKARRNLDTTFCSFGSLSGGSSSSDKRENHLVVRSPDRVCHMTLTWLIQVLFLIIFFLLRYWIGESAHQASPGVAVILDKLLQLLELSPLHTLLGLRMYTFICKACAEMWTYMVWKYTHTHARRKTWKSQHNTI